MLEMVQGFPSSRRWKYLHQLFNTISLMSGFSSNKILLCAISPAFREPRTPAVAVTSLLWIVCHRDGWKPNLTSPTHLFSRQCQSTRARERLRNIIANVTETKTQGAWSCHLASNPLWSFSVNRNQILHFQQSHLKNLYSNALCQCLKWTAQVIRRLSYLILHIAGLFLQNREFWIVFLLTLITKFTTERQERKGEEFRSAQCKPRSRMKGLDSHCSYVKSYLSKQKLVPKSCLE